MSDSRVTVVLAGTANLGIAVAKLVGGLLSGSSAMLSEAAHSFADTLNQAFLLAALRRSERPADDEHPFGYGKERYFWSLLAAVAVFVLGAGFSILQGVEALISPTETGGLTVSFVVLAVALVLEGTSWARAAWQLRREAQEAGDGFAGYLFKDAEPTVRAVFFEDSAAVIGLLLAGAGLALDELLDSHVYDAIASLAIGVLLIGVAYILGAQNRALLVGRAADPELVEEISEQIKGTEGIREVLQVLTMHLGTDALLVAARVDVEPGRSAEDLEHVADDVEARLRESHPEVRHVFVDPTPGGPNDPGGG